MDLFSLKMGASPLVVSIPHSGTFLPEDIAGQLTEEAHRLADTDWHVDRLCQFLRDLDVTVLAATHSRYVVDLNRPPDGALLYPGQNETALCPTKTFSGKELYKPNRAPDQKEIQRRREKYWQPYHQALQRELQRLKTLHGHVFLWDAHSIADQVPTLFEGNLPDLNFGTNEGQSCDEALSAQLMSVANDQDKYSAVLNGRFKGGYITRHNGDPAKGIHAVQLELSWATYMDGDPSFAFRDDLAEQIQPLLSRFITTLLELKL